MPAQITSLIDKVDTVEVVRDQIAAILLVESEGQCSLASSQNRDPNPWKLRVYSERSNPWSEFANVPETETHPEHATPIVNVALASTSYSESRSNVVEKQFATGTFNIDCYGYGEATASETGHLPGDEMAAFEAQRAVRLVRNILMSSYYTYLDLRGTVGKRWPGSVTMFQPEFDGRSVQHVVAARLALEVSFNEQSPQYEGQPLSELSAEVKRASDGQLLLRAQYP